jgi:hypothetical protein
MKNLSVFVLSLLIFSCGRNNPSESDYSDFTISMDTVVVDSGDEIMMAATTHLSHYFNDNFSRLYFWDSRSHSTEIIDLDELKLLEKRPFEKEGPNGIVRFSNGLNILSNDKIGFSEWEKFSIANSKGEVVERIKLNEDWIIKDLKEKQNLRADIFLENERVIFNKVADLLHVSSRILKLDFRQQQVEWIELPEFEKRDNFTLEFKPDDGSFYAVIGPTLNLTKFKNQLIFTTDALNAIYKYDLETSALTFHQITNTLTENEKSGVYKNLVTTQGEFGENMDKINEEVTFSDLFWDDKNDVFYRFTSFNLPRVAKEKHKSRVFISIINKDFEVIGEKEITEIVGQVPVAQFVKDGLIYCYINIDDELGYVRIKVN